MHVPHATQVRLGPDAAHAVRLGGHWWEGVGGCGRHVLLSRGLPGALHGWVSWFSLGGGHGEEKC